MSGSVRISRAIFAHECFAEEPFTEREAWVWLIMEASWKPRAKRMGDYIVDLERGQLVASVRFLAGAWKWTPAKVQRYLERLKKLSMIAVKTDTGVSVITVCNYDEYQAPAQAADTGPIQVRYRSDTNEKKDEIKGKKEGSARGTRLPADWSLPLDWSEWALAQGWASASIIDQAERFKDYWLSVAGAKGLKADWQATWRTWMRRSDAPKGAPRRADTVDIRSALADRIKSGKAWLVRDISLAQARELIAAGLVTQEDCRKAGVA
jgi:hypothetical protein